MTEELHRQPHAMPMDAERRKQVEREAASCTKHYGPEGGVTLTRSDRCEGLWWMIVDLVAALTAAEERAALAEGQVERLSQMYKRDVGRAAVEAVGLRAALRQATQERDRMASSVRWALGEEGKFPPYPGPKVMANGRTLHAYWYWRSELRERAFGATTGEEGA